MYEDGFTYDMPGLDRPEPEFTVTEALAVVNQVLETAAPYIVIIGEIANYKINQNKWVFFDIKDDESLLNCFMPLSSLRVAIRDDMKVKVRARMRLTKWGKFSLTVRNISPLGEGSIKKSFELLRQKLDKEGLFAEERKRSLPEIPDHIGVVSSVDAAGYRDFIKILGQRFSGLKIDVISTQVQGEAAPDQIISAIQQLNELPEPPQVIALLRGGGAREDLLAFDDEKLVRTIAASRVPIVTGVGHEIDVTLADLAADVRASTPSNAAEILVPNRRDLLDNVANKLTSMVTALQHGLDQDKQELRDREAALVDRVNDLMDDQSMRLRELSRVLVSCDPRIVLKRGYAMIWGNDGHAVPRVAKGEILKIETNDEMIDAEVKNVISK